MKALLLAMMTLGCGSSTLVGAGALRVEAVTPSEVSARGGVEIVVKGSGFSAGMKAWVRDAPVVVSVRDDASLSFTLPSLAAGTASLRVEVDGADAQLDDAFTVKALSLAFAEAASWQVPKVASPAVGLVSFDADLDGWPDVVAGAADGLSLVSWDKTTNALTAAPLVASTPMSPVVALDVDNAKGILAACLDDATTPLVLVTAAKDGRHARDDGRRDGVRARGVRDGDEGRAVARHDERRDVRRVETGRRQVHFDHDLGAGAPG